MWAAVNWGAIVVVPSARSEGHEDFITVRDILRIGNSGIVHRFVTRERGTEPSEITPWGARLADARQNRGTRNVGTFALRRPGSTGTWRRMGDSNSQTVLCLHPTVCCFGGEWGIRTPEGLHPTNFPSWRHRPLGEFSWPAVRGADFSGDVNNLKNHTCIFNPGSPRGAIQANSPRTET